MNDTWFTDYCANPMTGGVEFYVTLGIWDDPIWWRIIATPKGWGYTSPATFKRLE